MLRKVIADSGLKYKYIAQKLDIEAYSLQKKIDNVTEFKASEILKLCEVLNIEDHDLKEHIFFSPSVD
jgi:DNA-binding Xre family transcriptional regulator